MSNKITYYFQHDSNAREDEKIVALRIDMGAKGYGIYFMLLEILSTSKDCMFECNYKKLGYILHEDASEIKKVVENYNLFRFSDNGNMFLSTRLTAHMNSMTFIREKRANSANNRWKSNKENTANAMQVQCKCNANAYENECKCNANADAYNSIVKENKEKDMCVNARARVTPTPAASSEDTHTDFLFEIEKAFFLRGFISPQLIAKDMIDYYTGEGKDLQLLPLRQAVAKVTNWNPKKESDYTRTDTGIAALFVSLVERMDISTSSKLKMIEAYKCIAWSGDHLIFKFTDNFIASAFRTYCKDYDELLSKHFNGIMKFIDAE